MSLRRVASLLALVLVAAASRPAPAATTARKKSPAKPAPAAAKADADAAARPPEGPKPDLRTVAEISGWQETGRYDEVERLCRDFAATWPDRVACREFGRTPEDRPMLALVAGTKGALDPAGARAAGRTVVLAQGGIHAGEIDGKDAGFWGLRDLLEGNVKPGALDAVTFVFVPVFNVDGHERFGPNNRPNQNGPASMGWRTTAQNLNLNRDFVKADAPETQALLRLLDAWDPELFLDLHVTDGAEFQHDVGVMIEPAEAGPEPLRAPARALRDQILKALEEEGHLPLPFYPSFIDGDDPSSGTAVNAFSPRFAHGYWGWRERLGLLVETHSWKPYAVRVRATRLILLEALAAAARDGASWRAAARQAEAEAAALGGRDVPLEYAASKRSTPIDFLGVAFERAPSAVSGALVTRYDAKRPQTWTIPLFDELVPSVTARAPRGGYVVPAAHAAEIAARLDLHGVTYARLPRATSIDGEAWRATEVTFGAPFENRAQPVLKGAWSRESREVPKGSLFVPIAQPAGRLVTMLFDPAGTDSFVRWGFFNASFERKEYMEAYVAEQVAQDMLATQPALAAEFAHELAKNPAFAKDPAARLEFFYRRHASWDERLNLYPVLRTDVVPATQ